MGFRGTPCASNETNTVELCPRCPLYRQEDRPGTSPPLCALPTRPRGTPRIFRIRTEAYIRQPFCPHPLFLQLLPAEFYGRSGNLVKVDFTRRNLICGVNYVFCPETGAKRSQVLRSLAGQHFGGGEGKHSALKLFAKALTEPFYYSLYTRNIVVLRNYKRAECLPRLLTQNSDTGASSYSLRQIFVAIVAIGNFTVIAAEVKVSVKTP